MDATASTSDENIDWFYGAKKEEKRDDRQGKCTAIDEINDQKMSTSNHLLSEKKRTRFSLFEESLGCFNVFKRQRDALARMNEEGPHSRVFSFEHSLSNSGQRRYLVSTVERFWRWYEKREDASFYELIANGCPSRLYFDVEFYRESNNDAVESELIAAFNHCVRETLNEVFHIDIDPDKAMLVLDASTKTKFSEHIIVHLPGRYLFPSNVSMKKSFIDILEARMRDSGRAIVWNRDATKKITLCDTAVYTRNRNFRLYLSSKMGKNNPLVLSKRCRFYKESSKISNKQIFLDSLVIPAYNVRNEAILEPLSVDNTIVECSREALVLNIKVEPLSNEGSNFIEYLSGYGSSSPFPILDYHIISINRRWRDGVSIRMWKLSKDPAGRSRRITYYLAGCRYCFNIGREHRSNHVYWVVDLERFYCFQKCFDVDCRGTSSNYFPLPCFIRASIPTLKDIDEASVSEGIPSLKSMQCGPTSVDVKTIESVEHDEQSESEIATVRRKSAVFEKALMLKNIDSFYDEDLDEQLLRLQGNEDIENTN